MENSMMTWLFNYAPLTALTIFLTWAVWRFGALSGKYEARFTGIETDIRELKTEMKEVKSDIGEMKEKMAEMKQEMGTRLGRLEGQLELLVRLMSEKKVI